MALATQYCSTQIESGNFSFPDTTTIAPTFPKSEETVTTVNVTATITASVLCGGIITSTTAGAVTITTPTALQIITQLNFLGYRVANGDVYKLLVVNLGNANAITMAAGTNVAFSANNLTVAASSKVLYYYKILDNTGTSNPSIQFY